mgnify:CR=1 FL=1
MNSTTIIDIETEMLDEAYQNTSNLPDNIHDTKEIENFLQEHNKSTLIINDLFSVVGIVWAPGTDIIVMSTLYNAVLVDASNGELMFFKENVMYRYPETNYLQDFQIQDRLLFESESKLNQFLTLFQIKFSGWKLLNKNF